MMLKIVCKHCKDESFAVFGTAGGTRAPNRCNLCYIKYCQSRVCKHKTVAECQKAHSLKTNKGYSCWFSHIRPVSKPAVFKPMPID